MASIKFHVYRIDSGDNGTSNVDYRGKGELGAGENDQHRTIPQLEIDPADDGLIEEVLKLGPALNSLLKRFTDKQPDSFDKIADAVGLKGDGPIGLRVGVWDQ